MKLLIQTQTHENYGSHDWDGEGACPQYWKAKGGDEYYYALGKHGRSEEALTELVMALRTQIEKDNDHYREYIIGWEVVADDYLTSFERSQLEYDGKIVYAVRVLTLGEVNV